MATVNAVLTRNPKNQSFTIFDTKGNLYNEVTKLRMESRGTCKEVPIDFKTTATAGTHTRMYRIELKRHGEVDFYRTDIRAGCLNKFFQTLGYRDNASRFLITAYRT